MYNKNFINEVKQLTAEEIWKYDQNKKDFICKTLNNPIYLEIWENDYRKNPNKILQEILLYYNIKLDNSNLIWNI